MTLDFNPKNDAADVAAVLRTLGFEVLEGLDLDKIGVDQVIRTFASALQGADIGLFFYAGHGLQVGGVNYLVPIDAQLKTAAALDFEMVRLDLVQRVIEQEAKTSILFLDACRDNPLARNLARAMGTRSTQIGRGLAAAESGVGTLISYSTQPGNVALDGTGRNSPFAKALVAHLPTPGEDLSAILINIRKQVMHETNKSQIPWEHSALTDRFYFKDRSNVTQDRETGKKHGFSIELNRAEAMGEACRIFLVVDNKLDAPLQKLKLDVVVFSPDGDITRRFAVDMAPLRERARVVKLFDLDNTRCADVGKLLVNDVIDCNTEQGPLANCIGSLELSSRTSIEFVH